MESSGFDDLFTVHAPAVYRYVARRHQGSDVDDLVADVFTIAWQKIDEIPEDYELQWLYRTAWFVIANHHRKNTEVPVDLAEIELKHRNFEDDVADVTIEQEEMREIWISIPEREREILRLVAWEGLTPPQVAHVLGLSVGGASSAISRARKNLESLYEARTI